MILIPKVFFDANIYFCAARSPLGGSGLILELAKRKKIKLFATAEVLKEAEKNLRLKEKTEVLIRYYLNLRSLSPEMVKIDKNKAKKRFERIINGKDALVLAGAQKARVKFLVTLDRKHFFSKKVRLADLPFTVVNPGQLIEKLSAEKLAG